ALLAAARAAFPARAGDVGVLRTRLLHGDWPGMAAADPAECLAAQLRALPECDARACALRIVARHLDLLAARDETGLAKATGTAADTVHAALSIILGLRPHPVQAPTLDAD